MSNFNGKTIILSLIINNKTKKMNKSSFFNFHNFIPPCITNELHNEFVISNQT